MKRITDIMEPFSVVAEWAKIGKQSACRLGAMRVLALAKAYHPGLKPELLAGGFPEIKADETSFGKEDFLKVQREILLTASQIADSIYLSRLEVGFEHQGKRRKVIFPVPNKFILLPPL